MLDNEGQPQRCCCCSSTSAARCGAQAAGVDNLETASLGRCHGPSPRLRRTASRPLPLPRGLLCLPAGLARFRAELNAELNRRGSTAPTQPSWRNAVKATLLLMLGIGIAILLFTAPWFWLVLALAFLPVLAPWAAIESWDLAGQLGRFYSLSDQLPLARFLPPTVQVLVPVWLGTPETSKGLVAAAVHLPRPIGGWPIEAPILLLVLLLAVLYGAEVGDRLSAAQAAQAERTGESADRRRAEAETLADRSRNRRDRERNRGAPRRERQALIDALRGYGIEIDAD